MPVSLSKDVTSLALNAAEVALLLFGALLVLGLVGEYSESVRWKRYVKIFELFVILGVAGELVADGAIFLLSSHLQTLSDGEVARLNVDAESANATAKKFESQIAEANAKAEIARRNGRKYDRRVMAKSLAEFVSVHRVQATPAVMFDRHDDIPEGFGVISISATTGPWWGGESVNLTLDQIHQQIGLRIEAKNKLLPTYRSNLPNTPIWLLIYSGVEISRGVPIPHGFDEWTFPFEFDRVIIFSSLGNEVAEARRSDRGSNESQHIF
jgi:hypothetical protein